MPTLVAQPTRIPAAGTKPKLIDEYIGRLNTRTSAASVAHMRSPQGWEDRDRLRIRRVHTGAERNLARYA